MPQCCRATPADFLPRLRKLVRVDHQDRLRITQALQNVGPQIIAHQVCIPDGAGEQALHACATEARFRQLQECNTTGIDVVKAAPYLQPKGLRGQEHGVKRPGGLST